MHLSETMLPTPERRPVSSTRLRQLVDYVFGYDYFISYSHGDGEEYPRALAARLDQLGFTTFLDHREYVAGTDLRIATGRRVRMSTYLVVVVGPRALASEWVLKEVQACLAAGRTPIVIDLQSTFARAAPTNALKQALQDRIYLTERAEGPLTEPSAHIVEQIAAAFQAVRREVFRVRFATALAFAFAVIALAASYQFRQANIERVRAEEREAEARLSFARVLAVQADAEVLNDRFASAQALLVRAARLSAATEIADYLTAVTSLKYGNSREAAKYLDETIRERLLWLQPLLSDSHPAEVIGLQRFVDSTVQLWLKTADFGQPSSYQTLLRIRSLN